MSEEAQYPLVSYENQPFIVNKLEVPNLGVDMLWPAMIFIGEGKCTHTQSSFNEIYVEDIEILMAGGEALMR